MAVAAPIVGGDAAGAGPGDALVPHLKAPAARAKAVAAAVVVVVVAAGAAAAAAVAVVAAAAASAAVGGAAAAAAVPAATLVASLAQEDLTHRTPAAAQE